MKFLKVWLPGAYLCRVCLCLNGTGTRDKNDIAYFYLHHPELCALIKSTIALPNAHLYILVGGAFYPN